MKQEVIRLYDYHVWANRKVCEHLQSLSEEIYRKEIVSVFPTIYDAMVHIYTVDRGWLSFFEAGGVAEMTAKYLESLKQSVDSVVAETRGKRIEELGRMMEELAVRFRAFIERHADVGAVYPSGDFKARCMDYIQHMVNHGSYHRGNVTAMLRQLGHPGTPTDYGFYLYVNP